MNEHTHWLTCVPSSNLAVFVVVLRSEAHLVRLSHLRLARAPIEAPSHYIPLFVHLALLCHVRTIWQARVFQHVYIQVLVFIAVKRLDNQAHFTPHVSLQCLPVRRPYEPQRRWLSHSCVQVVRATRIGQALQLRLEAGGLWVTVRVVFHHHVELPVYLHALIEGGFGGDQPDEAIGGGVVEILMILRIFQPGRKFCGDDCRILVSHFAHLRGRRDLVEVDVQSVIRVLVTGIYAEVIVALSTSCARISVFVVTYTQHRVLCRRGHGNLRLRIRRDEGTQAGIHVSLLPEIGGGRVGTPDKLAARFALHVVPFEVVTRLCIHAPSVVAAPFARNGIANKVVVRLWLHAPLVNAGFLRVGLVGKRVIRVSLGVETPVYVVHDRNNTLSCRAGDSSGEPALFEVGKCLSSRYNRARCEFVQLSIVKGLLWYVR
mmetsp:Transcript_25855/g.65423  ORF Transcript_25855/g.65423 Transcript_25855/m.65423 type:complete len:431 (-) Transcript_25855:1778-3070(-)